MDLLTTDQPDLFFEDTPVGRMFKELWEADDGRVLEKEVRLVGGQQAHVSSLQFTVACGPPAAP